tara:strand:- start:1242 stop:1412 length:171 start_codon:yes stop_codon:yes gene_type:complete
MINYPTSSMKISATTFFNNMSDEDFMFIHKSGALKDLCTALSLDLHTSNTDERYEA